MKLDFISHDKLVPAKVNMRFGRKSPDVADILPSIRKRGILVPLIVRPAATTPNHFEIVAGLRRWTADGVVRGEDIDHGPLPCAILSEDDDAAAIEASLIENIARLDPDEVSQWETFVRLVREGREIDDITATFGLPDLAIRRILALGQLLPRIRSLYRAEQIDRATVRHLTLASKSQQRDWLALHDDPDACAPTGHRLKAWLFGGQSIPVRHALFDLADYKALIVSDLFGDDRFFADPDAFWALQNAAVEAKRAACLEQGWSDAVIVPPSEHFHGWEYEKATKRKGGRVFIDVRASGEVTIHEGYLTRTDAKRLARGEMAGADKPQRPELTSTQRTYVDLHRHAAVRAGLLDHPQVALRLLLAHAVSGSHLWRVTRERQATPNEEVRESVGTSRGEARFDERRSAVLACLGFAPDEPGVVGGRAEEGEGDPLACLFRRLLDLPEPALMDVIAVVIGETMAAGSVAVEAVGSTIGIDMADWWEADPAFFSLLRDREVLGRIVAEVAGETVAEANGSEKSKTLKRIVTDHLGGVDGRAKVERWVPRWMQFPPRAYTGRGGVRTVAALPDPDTEAEAFVQAA